MIEENETTLERLSVRFPEKSREYLSRALRNHGGDYEAAVAAIRGSFLSRFLKNLLTCITCGCDDQDDPYEYRRFTDHASTEVSQPQLVTKLKHIVVTKCPLFPNNLQTSLSARQYHRANFYREQAKAHHEIRKKYNDAAQQCLRSKNKPLAGRYFRLAKKEGLKMDEANHLAALTFLSENLENKNGSDVIDIHYLHKGEAIQALDIFFDKEIRMIQGHQDAWKMLSVITGKGLHSENKVAVLKPLVKNRLVERGLSYDEEEGNSGSLRVLVCYDSKLTKDIKVKAKPKKPRTKPSI